MDSLPIFYKDNVLERYSSTKKGEEDDICPICEDKQVNIMLDCYVMFFIEKNISISFVKIVYALGFSIKRIIVHFVV